MVVTSHRLFSSSGSVTPGSKTKEIIVLYPFLPQSCCCEKMVEGEEETPVVSRPLFPSYGSSKFLFVCLFFRQSHLNFVPTWLIAG